MSMICCVVLLFLSHETPETSTLVYLKHEIYLTLKCVSDLCKIPKKQQQLKNDGRQKK